MSTKAAAKLDVEEPDLTPATVTVVLRGSQYTFRELEIGEYNKLVKQASHQEADEDGVMQDVTDNTLLLQLMILKSCVRPKLTTDLIVRLGTRIYRAMSRVVNDLHFGEEPTQQIKDDEEASDEENPKGNA